MKWNAESLGVLELSSIAAGVRAADESLKAARVDLLEAIPISSGKFLVIFAGGVAEVEASLDAGRRAAGEALVDELHLAQVHSQVPAAIARARGEQKMGVSLGIVETTTVAAAIVGADAAAKAADIRLLEIAPGRGIGGKGFFTMTGDVASVQAGADAARFLIERRSAHLRTEILAGPHAELSARIGRILIGEFERLTEPGDAK
jgi:microcompartment protein CcmL/EutN